MTDWLTESLPSEGPLEAGDLVLRLLTALAFGLIVALVYRISHGREKADGRIMGTTLVLLAVLIAMVSLVIGNSVARAFSLVGALSIVRFRTVVEDTRDTAFVIFSVIVGMAVGAGLYLVPIIGIPIVTGAAVALNWRGGNGAANVTDATLTVRVGLGRNVDTLLDGPLERHTERRRLLSAGTARQGAALDFTYSLRLRSDTTLMALVAELNQLEGIQSVELRRS